MLVKLIRKCLKVAPPSSLFACVIFPEIQCKFLKNKIFDIKLMKYITTVSWSDQQEEGSQQRPIFVATSGCAAALWQTLPKAHTKGDQAEFLIIHTHRHTHTYTHTRTQTALRYDAYCDDHCNIQIVHWKCKNRV